MSVSLSAFLIALLNNENINNTHSQSLSARPIMADSYMISRYICEHAVDLVSKHYVTDHLNPLIIAEAISSWYVCREPTGEDRLKAVLSDSQKSILDIIFERSSESFVSDMFVGLAHDKREPNEAVICAFDKYCTDNGIDVDYINMLEITHFKSKWLNCIEKRIDVEELLVRSLEEPLSISLVDLTGYATPEKFTDAQKIRFADKVIPHLSCFDLTCLIDYLVTHSHR